jgi:hypothetical protein
MKAWCAVYALLVSSVVAIWALVLPPLGEIDQSVLVLVAQLLVFAATMLGVSSGLDKIKSLGAEDKG